jgi:hypothetical protein
MNRDARGADRAGGGSGAKGATTTVVCLRVMISSFLDRAAAKQWRQRTTPHAASCR